MSNASNNTFKVYRLTNPVSIVGYPFLAINKGKLLSYCDEHLSIGKVHWEVEGWLENDYALSEITFDFDLGNLDKIIAMIFEEVDYSLTAYFQEGKSSIDNITCAFNKGENNRELEIDGNDKVMAILIEPIKKLIHQLKTKLT